ALSIANKLTGVYAALTYEQLYIATENQVQKQHHGTIAGCFRSFLSLYSISAPSLYSIKKSAS
ncbi:MAG: hypothetical protein AB7F64_09810, partial [Gammaproteobacteria bacterium]